MRILVGATVAVLLCSCQSSELSGPTGGQSKKESADSQGDDSADEPVMVGGAHLICVELDDQSLAGGGKEIGCAINEFASGQKADLSPFQTNWVIKGEDGNPISVGTTEGSDRDPYHKRYSYRDDSYMKHTLNVMVQDNAGKQREYVRQLAVLDAGFNVNATPSTSRLSVGFLTKHEGEIPFKCSFGLTDNDDDDDRGKGGNGNGTDCYAGEGILATFGDFLVNVPCYGGNISDTYTFSRPGQKDHPLDFKKDACIINTQQLHPVPANYGCYKVPLAGPNGQFFIAIIEGDKVSPAKMMQMAHEYSCQNNPSLLDDRSQRSY